MFSKERQIEEQRQKLYNLFDSNAKEVAIVLRSGSFYIVHECDYEEVFENLKFQINAVHRVA